MAEVKFLKFVVGIGNKEMESTDQLTLGGISAGSSGLTTSGNFSVTGTATTSFTSTGNITAAGNPTWNFGTGQADFGGNLDANAGLDITGNLSLVTGTVSLTANGASTFTTSSGALSITSAVAATWKTTAGLLILDGAGGVQLQGNSSEIDLTTSGAIDINSGALTIDSSTMALTASSTFDLQATGNITVDSSGGTINLGTSGARTVTIGNVTSGTAVVIDSDTAIALNTDTVISGNLTVTGDTTTTSSETVLIADNHLYLNDGYTADAAQTGGLVVNYDPTSTVDTVTSGDFVAGINATSNPVVTTEGSGTFSANDLIQISGATEPANNGLFEVLSHSVNTLTIRGIGNTATLQDFTQNQFVSDITVQDAAITKVAVSILRAGTDGVWETGAGDTNALTFSDLATSSGLDLQGVYDNQAGVTVTGNVALNFDLTATISLDSTTGIDIGADPDTSAINIGTGSAQRTIIIGNSTGNTSVDLNSGTGGIGIGTAALDITNGITLGNSTGVTGITLNAGTNGINIGVNAVAHDITIGSQTGDSSVDVTGGTGGVNIGTNSIAYEVTIGNATGASGITMDTGTGGIDIGINAIAAEVTIGNATGVSGITMTTGTGGIDIGTNAVAATISVGNGQGASALTMTAGTGGYALTTDGSILLDATGTTGTTFVMRLGADTSAVDFAVHNNSGSDKFLVRGDGFVNAGLGSLNVPSGTSFQIATTALTTVNFTAANMDTLLDGSNADSLHTHAASASTDITLTVTAGAGGITDGDGVYISASGPVVLKTDATVIGTARCIGFATAAISAAAQGTIKVAGFVTNANITGTNLSVGLPVYVSETVGEVTATAPTDSSTVIVEVGIGTTTGNFIIQFKAPLVNS